MRIDLVTGCDGDFARHLAAMLLSLTETNPQHDFAVSVLWNGSASDRLKFERVLQGTPFSYSLIDISADDTLAGLTVSADMLHVTKMTYARLLVGALLPPKIDRVLYLDGDIIVRGDIGPLWTTDLGGKTAGAVIDLPHYARKSTLGLPPDAAYFNAGVLLIDLERWRRLKIGERAAEFARDHWDRMQWGDQCALNFVLQDDWKVLDRIWNFQTLDVGQYVHGQVRYPRIGRRRLAQARLVHFNGWSKPWHYLNDHPLKGEYLKYRNLTPWPLVRFEDRHPANILRKFLLRHTPALLTAYHGARSVFCTWKDTTAL